MNRISSLLILLSILFLGFVSCAKQGFPSGGPKDETPPVPLSATPPSGTTNFNSREFFIEFDEYVNIKDADNNVIISPVLSHKPEYKTKGHGILVKIKDTLQPSTTYLFQFKNAIVDYNEGNPLPSYEYVFSTGSSIDSMTIRGQVLDAFSRTASSEPVTVLAYHQSQLSDSIGDSIVAKERPMYMTRCDKDGSFALNHLRTGKYLLLAIEDGDKNMRLGNNEPVAFLDSLVTAVKMLPPPDTSAHDSTTRDTTAIDSLNFPHDSLNLTHDSLRHPADSVAHDSVAHDSTHQTPQILLLMSHEKKEVQHISKSSFLSKGRIEIITQVPLSPNYSLRHLTRDTTEPQVQLYHKLGPKGDTLNVWIGQKNCDSITLLLKDTTGLNDTLTLKYRKSKGNKASGLSNMRSLKSQPPIIRSLVSASHHYFDTLWLAFENPIEGICKPWLADSSALDTAVHILVLSDSSTSQCGIKLLHDSSLAPAMGLKAFLPFNGKPGEKYQFSIPAELFYDIWLNKSDSLKFTTELTKIENYGNIFLTLLPDSTQPDLSFPRLIIQLINEKGDMVQQQVVTSPSKISFLHLKGGKYSFRAIFDRDSNSLWSPGNYWLHRQPEEIIKFEKVLELRENWDMEEKWLIKKPVN